MRQSPSRTTKAKKTNGGQAFVVDSSGMSGGRAGKGGKLNGGQTGKEKLEIKMMVRLGTKRLRLRFCLQHHQRHHRRLRTPNVGSARRENTQLGAARTISATGAAERGMP